MGEHDARPGEGLNNEDRVQDAGLDEKAERLVSSLEELAGTSHSYEQTIGLLGGRSQQSTLKRGARAKRVRQMLSIVRRYDILHGLTPKSLRRMLEELGPTFVKAGQILSMRSEILPEAFCAELAHLRTEVDPMPIDEVIATLEGEYNVPLDQIFSSIDDTPLGSASVAQVHRARLVSGEDVAVKVQRPGVRELMAQDIAIMRSIASRAKVVMGSDRFIDISSVVEELWQSFREETDFSVEARSLEEFRANNAACAFILCPKPYMRLCTRHVVVMDYVDGIPISQYDRLVEAGYDLEEIGTKLVDNYAGQMLDDGFFHADPHPGNILISGGKIAYIDLGIMGRLTAHDRSALKDIVFAVGDLDTPRLKDGLLRFSVGADTAAIDHARLLADLDTVVADYGTATLSELDLSGLFEAIINLARRSGIELPGSVTMLARSLVTLEGTVDELLAKQSIVDIIASHIKESQSWSSLAQDEAQALVRDGRLASHSLLGAASQASLAMSMLTRGQLRMNMDIAGSKDPLADFSHAFDRLTMGIVIAGLFIGSSVIYYSGTKPLLFGVPVLGFLGFVLAVVLGVWLFVDIMREGRRRR